MEKRLKNNLQLGAAVLLSVLLSAPVSAGNKKDDSRVALTEVRNYFHRNDAPLPSEPLITTQQEFDKQFGTAAFMGRDGQPTKVNFRKQAVVAIVLPETNTETDIDSVCLNVTGKKQLTLSYLVRRGTRNRSYTAQPIRLMAIARKYAGYEVSVKATERQEVQQVSTTLTTACYTSAARDIHIQVDYPVDGAQAVTDSVQAYIRNVLSAYVKGWNVEGSADAVSNVTAREPNRLVADCADAVYVPMKAMNDELRDMGRSEARCSALLKLMRTDETETYVTYETVTYNYMGGAHGLGSHRGVTFDKATGRRLTMVRDEEGLRKLITERLKKTYDDVTFNEEPVPLPQESAFMRGDKIVFVYQPYEIGAYAIGMPECSFYPYEIEEYVVRNVATAQ